MRITDLLDQSPFALSRVEKAPIVLAGLRELIEHHRRESDTYRLMVDTVFGASASTPSTLAVVPWLPVGLFKRLTLLSVRKELVIKQLVSSGTTGQAVSRIYLDRETAHLQTKALSRIAREFLGRRRLPMIVVDDRSFLTDRASLNARAAGILGFSTFGRDHFYLLDERLEPDLSGLEQYLW